MTERLGQNDRDDLSAYLDGELSADEAERVRSTVEADPAWADALRELGELDALLDAWAPPEAPADLGERIIAAADHRPRGRVLSWPKVFAGAMAAAAAILLAIGVGLRVSETTPETEREEIARPEPERPSEPIDPADMTEEQIDEFAVENLGFFKDYDVLTDFETLEAIERVERARSSGT